VHLVAPRRDINQLRSEVEELFADLWQVPGFAGLRGGFHPRVDCFRTADPPRLTVVVEIAGVDTGSIRLEVTERELVVSGERRREPSAARSYERMEIDHGPFERRIALRDAVDADAATTSYDAGMLTVVLPIVTSAPRARQVVLVVGRRR
jgi:HSP20 family molecular chaperone IbpA